MQSAMIHRVLPFGMELPSSVDTRARFIGQSLNATPVGVRRRSSPESVGIATGNAHRSTLRIGRVRLACCRAGAIAA
jgi:hypothetical protein